MNSDQASKVIEEYHSNDPFIIAEKMDINVFTRPLIDIGGYYMVLKNLFRMKFTPLVELL